MKKRLYIHIGTPKTGTSTIQYFLYQNKDVLENKGYFYPTPCDTYGGKLPNLRSIILMTNADGTHGRTLKDIEKDWKKYFLPQINESGCQNIIVSEETLTNINPEFYKIFKKDFDIKVIVYIRRPADIAMADWAQIVSMGHKLSFERYVCSNHITYLEKIINHIKFAGKENFIVRVYEKEQWKNGNLISDFLDCLGLELTDEYKTSENRNISPSRNKTEIIRLIKGLNLNHLTSVKYNTEICSAKSVKDTEVKAITTMSDEEMEIVTRNAKPYIDEVAKLAGKEKLFVNEYPDCYKKQRPVFNGVTLSCEELEILHKAINEKNKEIENLKNDMFFYSYAEENHKVFKIGKIRIKFKIK